MARAPMTDADDATAELPTPRTKQASPLNKTDVQDQDELLFFLRSNQARYLRLAEEAEFVLQDLMMRSGVKVHSISSRVKDIDSALEKATRKGYESPSDELEDLAGCRIVCLFMSDLDKMAAAIKEEFQVHKSEDKVQGEADSATFGYMSMHYICELSNHHSGPRYDSLKGIKFEIQCRTILMDAWANVSHHLAYKGENSIPSDLRRDFNALSGLFYVADKHFELFYQEADESRTDTVREAQAGRLGDEQELNLETMLALFSQIYPDRSKSTERNVSEFVEEVTGIGYATVGKLRYDLERGFGAADAYYNANPGDDDIAWWSALTDVGVARISLAAASKQFAMSKYGAHSTDHFWKRYQSFMAD
jgi:putative GTP pyrophosphokinase